VRRGTQVVEEGVMMGGGENMVGGGEDGL
jgi:hypothetical protein